jgi:hypothetical protein
MIPKKHPKTSKKDPLTNHQRHAGNKKPDGNQRVECENVGAGDEIRSLDSCVDPKPVTDADGDLYRF